MLLRTPAQISVSGQPDQQRQGQGWHWNPCPALDHWQNVTDMTMTPVVFGLYVMVEERGAAYRDSVPPPRVTSGVIMGMRGFGVRAPMNHKH